MRASLRPYFGIWINYQFVCAIEEGKVVGAVKVYTGPYAASIHIEMFEVAAHARGRHLSRPLMNAVVDYAAEHHKMLTNNGFSEDGNRHLSKLREEICRRKGVECSPVSMGRV